MDQNYRIFLGLNTSNLISSGLRREIFKNLILDSFLLLIYTFFFPVAKQLPSEPIPALADIVPGLEPEGLDLLSVSLSLFFC